MKFWGIAAVAALALAGTANRSEALPACGGGTDVLTYNAGGGCEVAGLIFSEFDVQDAGVPGTPLVNAITAILDGNTVYFNFNPNLATPGFSEDINFFFKVSSASGAPIINGVDLKNWGTGNSSISETVCAVAFGPLGCSAGNTLATMMANSGGVDDAPFAAVSSAYIFKDIFAGLAVVNPETQQQILAEGHITRFTQSFHTTVPEPASLLLLGTGLAAAARARRRAQKSQA